MSVFDYAKIGMGMLSYEKKLKKLGITPRENILMAFRHEVPKVVSNYILDAAMMIPAAEIERYTGTDKGKDWYGVEWVYDNLMNAPITLPGTNMLDDITKWKEVVNFPDLEAFDWENDAKRVIHQDMMAAMSGKGYVELKKGKTVLDGGKLGVAVNLNGMFERLHSLMGMENALMSLLLEPECCFEFFSAVADYKIAFYKKIRQYYPVGVINAHDDYGTTGRLFMSPDTWRELLKPNLKRMVDGAHELGLIYEHHSCGYVEPLIPDFVEIGIDAINPLQGNCNLNTKELKKKYGDRLTFIGGVDNINILENKKSTRKECIMESRRVINELAPGGSFIVLAAGSIMRNTSAVMADHFGYSMNFYKKN